MSASNEAAGWLTDWPIVLEFPVQWGDMDAYQHVNNLVYLRYFESARVELLLQCGLEESKEQDQIGAILRDTRCRYRIALTYPDTVLVGGRVTTIDDDRFAMEYRVASKQHGKVAAEGAATVVCVDYATGSKTALPAPIRDNLARFQRGQ